MLVRTKRLMAGLSASALLVAGIAAPAGAQPQQGLVNVNIEDVQVTVPINAAANICGVSVNVLVLALQAPGPQTFTECDARSNQDVTVTG
jgi:hypothetical protein